MGVGWGCRFWVWFYGFGPLGLGFEVGVGWGFRGSGSLFQGLARRMSVFAPFARVFRRFMQPCYEPRRPGNPERPETLPSSEAALSFLMVPPKEFTDRLVDLLEIIPTKGYRYRALSIISKRTRVL